MAMPNRSHTELFCTKRGRLFQPRRPRRIDRPGHPPRGVLPMGGIPIPARQMSLSDGSNFCRFHGVTEFVSKIRLRAARRLHFTLRPINRAFDPGGSVGGSGESCRLLERFKHVRANLPLCNSHSVRANEALLPRGRTRIWPPRRNDAYRVAKVEIYCGPSTQRARAPS